MRRAIKLYIFIISFIFITFGPAISRAEYDIIDITKPFLRKIPLAVPLFKNAGGSAEEKQSSESAADFLSDTLDFTGYFKILDRGLVALACRDQSLKLWLDVGPDVGVNGLLAEPLQNRIADLGGPVVAPTDHAHVGIPDMSAQGRLEALEG